MMPQSRACLCTNTNAIVAVNREYDEPLNNVFNEIRTLSEECIRVHTKSGGKNIFTQVLSHTRTSSPAISWRHCVEGAHFFFRACECTVRQTTLETSTYTYKYQNTRMVVLEGCHNIRVYTSKASRDLCFVSGSCIWRTLRVPEKLAILAVAEV